MTETEVREELSSKMNVKPFASKRGAISQPEQFLKGLKVIQ